MTSAVLLDFALVAQHGSFSLASRASGRSKATLSRHIAALEEGLGIRLFERADQGLTLTEAGGELVLRTAGPLKDLDDAVEAVRHGGPLLRGRLRISAAVVFAHSHLARIGAAFSRLHPGIELEIVADDRFVDPVQEGFDVVIRANPDADDRLVGTCILRTDRVAVAAPDLQLPSEKGAARLLCRSAERPPESWRLNTPVGQIEVRLDSVIRFSTLLMIREAAIHGAGVALLPRTLVQDDLTAGRLSEWGVEAGAQTEIWALHTSRRLANAKVSGFLSYLKEALADLKA